MARSRLGIRPYVPEDLDEARFTISRSMMEPLAEANKRSAVPVGHTKFPNLTMLPPRLLPPNYSRSMGYTLIRFH